MSTATVTVTRQIRRNEIRGFVKGRGLNEFKDKTLKQFMSWVKDDKLPKRPSASLQACIRYYEKIAKFK